MSDVLKTYDEVVSQVVCDLCDERPAVAKLVVFGIETLVCEHCQGDDDER